jgi:hypothetical protein
MAALVNSCILLLCGLFMLPGQAAGSTAEEHLYLRKTGAESSYFNWRLEPGTLLRLITDLQQERDITRMNADLETREWSVKDPAQKIDLQVTRRDNSLLMTGLFKDSTISRKVSIDDAPWYQALSLSLRQFINPNRDHLEFWSIRPDTLDVHKLQVTRSGEELVDMNGTMTRAIKLKIQLTGLKSMFWSCHYWLRKEDGLFIRYQGPSGPPGWPETIVELVASPTHAMSGPAGEGQ